MTERPTMAESDRDCPRLLMPSLGKSRSELSSLCHYLLKASRDRDWGNHELRSGCHCDYTHRGSVSATTECCGKLKWPRLRQTRGARKIGGLVAGRRPRGQAGSVACRIASPKTCASSCSSLR